MNTGSTWADRANTPPAATAATAAVRSARSLDSKEAEARSPSSSEPSTTSSTTDASSKPNAARASCVLFDFAGAAAAVAELDAEERDRVREVLLDSILAMRTEDGAFLDFAMIGADYGAGMARIALGELVGE
jgi:hypothetical protein